MGDALFPLLKDWFGLRGTLLLTAGVAVLGFALTLVLPNRPGAAWKTCTPARLRWSLTAAGGRFHIAPGGIELLILTSTEGK